MQKKGIDFKALSSLSKYYTLRALKAVAAVEDLEVHQLDIKTAFLNGILEVEVDAELPAGTHAADNIHWMSCAQGTVRLKPEEPDS